MNFPRPNCHFRRTSTTNNFIWHCLILSIAHSDNVLLPFLSPVQNYNLNRKSTMKSAFSLSIPVGTPLSWETFLLRFIIYISLYLYGYITYCLLKYKECFPFFICFWKNFILGYILCRLIVFSVWSFLSFVLSKLFWRTVIFKMRTTLVKNVWIVSISILLLLLDVTCSSFLSAISSCFFK